MNRAPSRRIGNALLAVTLTSLFACGGGEPKEAPQQACPACPVCAATPSPAPLSLSELLENLKNKNVKKFRTNPEAFMAAANQFGIADKLGKKEIAVEEFPKFVSFFWAVDAEFRIQYLRAMMTGNRLVDMLKPVSGKFDVNVAPKDPEAEDVSLLISNAIVDWAQVQRTLEDDFMGLGVENVMGVKPGDEMPHAEAMMKDLLAIVAPQAPSATPVPTAGPKAASLDFLSWLEGSAWAQQLASPSVKTTKTGAAPAKSSKAVPRVKVKQAPFLLARVISYNVGGKNFVLQSPLMAAIPEFQAVPVEQFQFAIDKLSVGPGYRDSVDVKVQELAAKPNRDMVDWWALSHGLIELRLLNQLVDYSKVAPEPLAPASGGVSTAPAAVPPSGGVSTAPAAAGSPAERPAPPSGLAPAGSGAAERPALPGGEQRSEAGALPRPAQPSAAEAPSAATPPKTELPSGSQPAGAATTRPPQPSGALPSP